jgi:predicted PurR-regulated permease PerM
MSLLVNQDKLLALFHQINPLGPRISKLYAERTAVMTKAMARGQFIIAFVQGTTDALLLYLAGLHSLFFFFVVLLTALSIIPLGGGIVAIPIGIGMILTGHIWQGALVVLGHILIVTNEDNVMRPRLVPQEARLDPALTLVSVFSGLAMFGFLGIVIGPVIMILIVTTIQVFMEVFKKIESVKEAEAGAKHKKSLAHTLTFWKKT